jgi:tyrosyl-tRNA synthetase
MQAGLASSKSEARRLLRDGGVRLNNTAIPREENARLMPGIIQGAAKLSAGKKRHVHVIIKKPC